MGTLKGSSNLDSARKKWDRVFDALVKIIRTQQTQIESLANERKKIEDRIKLKNEEFGDQISQMKSDLAVQEMLRNFEAAYSDLLMGQKQREAFSYKIKLEDAVSELADFRAWFDHLSSKCSETNENSSKMLALLSERNFIWNQYKTMEGDLTDRLKSKSTEVEQANEKIKKLLSSMERLQSSNSEKDRIILKLETNTAEFEEASVKKSEEISRLSRELELLRKGRSDSATPVLRLCSVKARSNEGNDARNNSSQIIAKGCGSSKRKAVDDHPILISETPKLFTSAFKVPKLKISSPGVS